MRRNPERTRSHILTAATAEFCEFGFGGARIDGVATRAGVNKRMIYHYFGNKETLYTAVLEAAYASIRCEEAKLDLLGCEPVDAIRRLVQYSFDHHSKHPEFIRLLNDENLHAGKNVRRSESIPKMNTRLLGELSEVLRQGAQMGVFRNDVDPLQLYISIAGLGYFFFSNNYTLSAVFGHDLAEPDALDARRTHMVAVILGYLRPDGTVAHLPVGRNSDGPDPA
ncbi:MAG: TetR family transcriptional regulator [Pseudomonadota bacterium]